MDCAQERRDGYYFEKDDQEEQFKHPPFAPSSAATSTSSGGPSTSNPAIVPPIEKEHMFDKVVTPSDVGKLNRLVIPKQHAEKYFPLDMSTNEKGLLLNFEDRMGKPWRFRYSYWNSSQSYVMTKGWSRFVKEMRLDAGDTVSFERGVGETIRDRFFIDWKRRPSGFDPPAHLPHLPLPNNHPMMTPSFAGGSVVPWGRLLAAPVGTMYDHHRQSYRYNAAANPSGSSGQYLYLRSPVGSPLVGDGWDGAVGMPMVLESMPAVVHRNPTAKRVRLFGVNLECPSSNLDANGSSSIVSPRLQSQSQPTSLLQLRLGAMESSLEMLGEEHSPFDLDN